MIDLLLADDQALVRGGFSLILDSEADLRVVAKAEDGEQAVAEAIRTRPDVVLMDIRMPRLTGSPPPGRSSRCCPACAC